ncbi:ribonuclease T2 [Ranunculus cassubicifolius]
MKAVFSICILLFSLQLIRIQAAPNFDFFYFIQQVSKFGIAILPIRYLPYVFNNISIIVLQWPGSYCGTKQGCCYPKTGKPASDFVVYGLQPWTNLGEPVVNCDPKTHLNLSKISDFTKSLNRDWPLLSCPRRDNTKLWSIQWKKYGACSGPEINQHAYFEGAIKLKKKVNLLQVLKNAGVVANGSSYKAEHVLETIRLAVGHMPGIRCVKDRKGYSQLNVVYTCANGAYETVECPGIPPSNCNQTIKFPSF